MKAEIDRKGIMHIYPQNEMEIFALNKWVENDSMKKDLTIFYMQTENEAKEQD